MSIIVLIPGLWAAYIAFTQSPHRAFIYVYIPVLLFLPDYYDLFLPGIPDPTFQSVAIFPIFVAWLVRGVPGWRFSFTDLLVFGYSFSIGYSEYTNAGYKDAQNFIANDVIMSILLPYILAKCLVEPAGLRESFAKSIVLTLSVVSILNIFQFVTLSRFTPLTYLLGPLFGGGWYAGNIRYWILVRVNGPYVHEILAGIIMWIGYRIQRWLEWSQVWPTRIPQLPWLRLPIAQLLTLIIFMGAFVTLVRGPLVAAIVAAIAIVIGRSKRRWLIFWLLVAGSIIVGIPAVKWFIDYATAPYAESRSQETIIYRWDLVVNYIDIAKEKLIWGWGRTGWPKVPGQKSVDNYFLLLFLGHGITSLGFLVTILLLTMTRLFIHSMFQPVANPPGSSLGFTLFSLYIVVIWSIATVWLGHQTQPLLFLIVGWSEGYLHSNHENLRENSTTVATTVSPQKFKFRRVLS
ncbi:MAG: hypothetical protein BWK79_01770 [Beggiatoa sp. IS2]|nr:MAG: hypothetical protein BWK79_01770 [Beggiatoa sp. IS2]